MQPVHLNWSLNNFSGWGLVGLNLFMQWANDRDVRPLMGTPITPQELAEIQAMHFEMMAAYTRRDLSTYYTLNARIHSAISAAAKNPVLAQVYTQVNARLQALRFRSNQDGEKWKRAVKEHEKMIEALVAHDGAAMRAILDLHLRNKRDVVLEQLRETAKNQRGAA